MTYTSLRAPRAKQAEALVKLQNQQAFALQMEMRTGKTKVLTDHFGRLLSENKVDDLVVIAPAGAYRPWDNEIKLDMALPGLKIHVWAARDKSKAKQAILKSFMTYYRGPRILLMNVEALSTVKEAKSI